MAISDVQPDYDDIPVMEQLTRELDIPEGAEVVAGIVFEQIATLLREGVPDPLTLIDDVMYEEGLHLVSGAPGDGKTSWVMHLARMLMENDSIARDVIWLDYENGERPTIRRLLAVGVDPETAVERFHYAFMPPEAEEHLAEVAERWPNAVVVIDSLSKALSFAGINENANEEVLKWTTPVIRQCKRHNIPIVVIDHVSKDGKDSAYSRGASTKLADVDVHWRVIKTALFNKETVGSIEVRQMKDREGGLPFTTWWTMGDGHGKLIVDRTDQPPEEGSAPADTPDI